MYTSIFIVIVSLPASLSRIDLYDFIMSIVVNMSVVVVIVVIGGGGPMSSSSPGALHR